MKLFSILLVTLELIKLLFGVKAKKDKDKEEAIKELKDGLKKKDTSAITAAFTRINQL